MIKYTILDNFGVIFNGSFEEIKGPNRYLHHGDLDDNLQKVLDAPLQNSDFYEKFWSFIDGVLALPTLTLKFSKGILSLERC